jgi:hypothetical protein
MESPIITAPATLEQLTADYKAAKAACVHPAKIYHAATALPPRTKGRKDLIAIAEKAFDEVREVSHQAYVKLADAIESALIPENAQRYEDRMSNDSWSHVVLEAIKSGCSMHTADVSFGFECVLRLVIDTEQDGTVKTVYVRSADDRYTEYVSIRASHYNGEDGEPVTFKISTMGTNYETDQAFARHVAALRIAQQLHRELNAAGWKQRSWKSRNDAVEAAIA